MTPEQALKNLEVVALQFRGTFEEHQALQESLRIIKGLVAPTLEDVKEEKEVKTES